MQAADPLLFEDAGFPNAVRPMQAVSAEAPFSAEDYVFEVKWDGLRALVFVAPDGSVHVHDRGLNDITDRLPELKKIAGQVPAGTVLDGELVATDSDGRPDYQTLRERLAAQPGPNTPLAYLAFGLLYLEGKPLLRQPLLRRKTRLRKVVESGGVLFVPDYIVNEGVELFEACLERGLEGVMAKHRESTYVPGQRSPFWLKVKAVKSDDFVVLGTTAGRDGERFGALMVGYYEGGRLLPCGSVGGGFDEEALAALTAELDRLSTDTSPLTPVPILTAPVSWCRPQLVISVRYSEWAPDGTLRFPIFNGIRPEVHPAECVRPRPRVVLGGRIP